MQSWFGLTFIVNSYAENVNRGEKFSLGRLDRDYCNFVRCKNSHQLTIVTKLLHHLGKMLTLDRCLRAQQRVEYVGM